MTQQNIPFRVDLSPGSGPKTWRALRMSERLKAGIVWVNSYRAVSFTSLFGGCKRSGIGRESGVEAVREFLQTKPVWIAMEKTRRNPLMLD